MNKKIITFEANEQSLIKTGGISNYSSNKVSYIEAEFELGENWQGFDAVRAIWYNKSEIIATVLSDGHCTVPYEVLTDKGQVKVNLVGSISEGDVLTDRLTSYPVVAFIVDAEAKVNGSNTQPITPSEYEQFVASVRNDADRAEQGASDAETYANNAETSADDSLSYSQNAEGSAIRASGYALDAQGYAQNASDSAQSAENYASDAEDARDEIRSMSANATTLPAGSSATASYSDGVLSLGIPQGIQGEKGDNGDTGATPNLTIGTVTTLPSTEDAYVTRTGTDENPVFNFGIPQGPKGEQGEVSLDELSALLPTDTASGDIASFSDGTDLFPALSVKAQIEPIQDLHGYDKPWSGGAGKNKLPPKTGQAGVGQLILGDDATGIASASGVYLKSGTYTISVNSTKTSTMYWYDVSSGENRGIGNTLAPRTVTVSADGYYFPFLYNSSGISSADVSTFQLEEGSSATAWTPYENLCPISGHTECVTIVSPTTDAEDGATYTTTLGRTVYGGTLDVVSGVLVVDRAIRTLNGTEAWDLQNTAFTTYLGDSANIYKSTSTSAEEIVTADRFKSNGIKYRNDCGDGNIIKVVGNNTQIACYSSVFANVDEFKASLVRNPMQITYELATPQTYQLDPQTIDLLLGQNNLWTDCGSVEVTYKADIERWVNKKINALI